MSTIEEGSLYPPTGRVGLTNITIGHQEMVSWWFGIGWADIRLFFISIQATVVEPLQESLTSINDAMNRDRELLL